MRVFLDHGFGTNASKERRAALSKFDVLWFSQCAVPDQASFLGLPGDEGIDFQSMGRIFIGLVKCGAWGCFDEFNRLKEDQLSAISQQIQLIQDAIKGQTPVLRLLGRDIDVDFNAGIFVTLNPAGKDYGGRSQIPDNLKALFRPVAMGRPDNELIAQVYLQAEGFAHARDLAACIRAASVRGRFPTNFRNDD